MNCGIFRTQIYIDEVVELNAEIALQVKRTELKYFIDIKSRVMSVMKWTPDTSENNRKQ